MKKVYEGHENVYKKMSEEGILSWDARGTVSAWKKVEADKRRILKDVLAQPWAPGSGKAIELGCGTGPILRWICKKGFSGVGIDVSKTAIAMAKEQSKSLELKFRQADICRFDVKKLGKFDLVIDGLCLHCIVNPKDRRMFLEKSFEMLKKGGLFVVMSMCCPCDRKLFSRMYAEQKVRGHTIYSPFERGAEIEGFRMINGQGYIPTRKVPHWKSILSEIRQAGFQVKLLRYTEADKHSPFGYLVAGALT